jgi:glycosyltransferase involved in cell wall biosynthesis
LGPLVAFILNWGSVSIAISVALASIAALLHVYYRHIYIPMPVFLIRLAAFTAVQLILAAMFRHYGSSVVASIGAKGVTPLVEDAPAVPMQGKVAVNFLESSPVITMSVVLPCANEGRFAWKTAESIAENTPIEILHEIIIVDDGSSPPLISQFPPEIIEKAKVKFVRHESHTGLINAKSAGANVATGDVIVFLDCHVKPDKGWARPIVEKIRANYKRVVVPNITGLDPDTWEEVRGNGGQAKCYLTWDADFKWFDSDDEQIAVMSGGLLAMSRQWWIETGGYDTSMQGWGGENLDQSLRIWLCGGEIVNAKDSYVGHMWRTHDKPETIARYTVPPGSVIVNRYKGTSVWMSEWVDKLETFSVFKPFKAKKPDVSSITAVRDRLACKNFSYFIDKFYKVYHWGGFMPKQVFHLRDMMSGMCLQRSRSEDLDLAPCSDTAAGQLWHRSNRDGEQCCSGYRNWNTDQCITGSWVGGHPRTSTCNIGGLISDQFIHLTSENQLEMSKRPGACLGGKLKERPKAEFKDCSGSDGGFHQKFKKVIVEPESLGLAIPGQEMEIFRLEDSQKPCTCLAAMGTRLESHDCDPKSSVQFFSVISGSPKTGGERRLVAVGLTGTSTDTHQLCVDAGLPSGQVGLYMCYNDSPNSNQSFEISDHGESGLTFKFKNNMCVSVPVNPRELEEVSHKPMVLSECIAEDGLIKRGQYFEKVAVPGEPNTFSLKTKDDLCVSVNTNNELVLAKHACSIHLFKQDPNDSGSRLVHVPTGLCFDGNNGHTPSLYACYPGDNSNQQVEFVNGNSIKLDRTNTCLDFEPAEPSPVNVVQCSVSSSAFKWQEYKPFVPIETEIYNKHKQSQHSQTSNP